MVDETMETKLRALAQSVAKLREATDGGAQSPSKPIQPSAPVFAPVSPPSNRAELLQRAAIAAAAFAGFRPAPQLVDRLAELCRNRTVEDLVPWVHSLEVDGNPAELSALVEDLVNHETHFLRDEGQLRTLQQELLPEIIDRKQRSGDRRLVIWSAGCATGEEPYTLAMLVLEAMIEHGLADETTPGCINLRNDWELSVLGTDISRRAVAVAREAVYNTLPPGSFRGFPPRYLRFFDHIATAPLGSSMVVEHRRVKPAVSRYVEFRVYNLMSRGEPLHNADIVLCRNVLIYLESKARSHAQQRFRRALAAGGVLVLSAVDTLVATGFNTRRCGSHAFYQRQSDTMGAPT